MVALYPLAHIFLPLSFPTADVPHLHQAQYTQLTSTLWNPEILSQLSVG